MNTTPDAITKTMLLDAPRSVVWQAVSDAEAFGAWFGAKLEGPFEAGQAVDATILPTTVDPEIAKAQEPYRGTPFTLYVEKVEPPQHLSFRWHPGSGPPAEGDPTTLVVFELAEEGDQTRITITESGFAAIPLERRAKAFADNEGGWDAQLGLIRGYLAKQAR